MKGRKRFIITDTLGLVLAVHVVAANIQDRDGAKQPLLWTRLDHPEVRKVWADQGFAGRLVEWTTQILGRDLEIVRKDPGQRGFQVQPKRWAVELRLLELDAAGALTSAHVRAGAQVGGVNVRTVWRWLEAALTEGRIAGAPGKTATGSTRGMGSLRCVPSTSESASTPTGALF